MFDHISIGVRDVTASKRFYDTALRPLGFTCVSQSPGSLGYGVQAVAPQAVALWVNEAARPVPADERSGLHFCFAAPTRDSVGAFHAGALREAAATMADRACAPTMARTITRPSLSIRTAIAWRPIAALPPNLRF